VRDLIINILDSKPNLTGREIANILGKEKREINSFLDKNRDVFYKDELTFRWCNYKEDVEKEIIITFPSGWVDAEIFETNILVHSNLFEEDTIIRFVFKGTQLLLDAILRLLCLANQLSHRRKKVYLDFCSCMETYRYLNRLGFFQHLHQDVYVLPNKPFESLAKKYNQNSNSLIEIFEICPHDDNNNEEVLRISEVFKNNFSDHEIRILLPKLQMFIGSLIDNVREHGYSDLVGYSALQIYHKPVLNQKKIILVIADNGSGLTTTLRKALTYPRYKEVAHHFMEQSIEDDKKLIAHVLNEGGITQTNDENRGLGLNEVHQALTKISKQETINLLELENIDVRVSIRQDDCQINFPYKYNFLKEKDLTHRSKLTKIYGTQFILTILLTK